MKAFTRDAFGPPEVLRLAEVDTPVPGPGEVLVRTRATSVNPYDWHHLRGEPYVARLTGAIGVRRPKLRVLGADLAGEVVAVGPGARRFHVGDEVYGLLASGAFAEFACARETDLAPMPANLSFEQAAAVPLAAITALIAVRDDGRVRPGHKVLVNGASGGVGTFAVQLAKADGAEVTAVCRTGNADLVRSLGADHVVDYTTTDFTRAATRYDVLLDIAGSRPASACRRVLAPGGAYVFVGGPAGRWWQPAGRAFATVAMSRFVRARMALTDVVRAGGTADKLAALSALIEAGRVTPVIDRRYKFAEIPAAVAYQEAGHAPGKVVVNL